MPRSQAIGNKVVHQKHIRVYIFVIRSGHNGPNAGLSAATCGKALLRLLFQPTNEISSMTYVSAGLDDYSNVDDIL